MILSCSYPILLYRPSGQKASVMISVMICNALYDILINWYLYLYGIRWAPSHYS